MVENSVTLAVLAWVAGFYLFYLFATHDAGIFMTVILSIAIPWGVYSLARLLCSDMGERKMKPECACGKAAVAYIAWHGTTHHFYMYNEDYVKLFLKENIGRAYVAN